MEAGQRALKPPLAAEKSRFTAPLNAIQNRTRRVFTLRQVSDSDPAKHPSCAILGFVPPPPANLFTIATNALVTTDSTHLKPPILGFSRLRHLEYALTCPTKSLQGAC